jgi:hypothetical protein
MKRNIILAVLLAFFVTSTFAQRPPTLTDDDVEATKTAKPKVEEKSKPTAPAAKNVNSNWTEVAPAASGFKILMPARPKASSQVQELPMLGKTELHLLQVSERDNFYQAAYFKLSESSTVNINSSTFQQAFFSGMTQGFVRSVQGELVKEATVNHEGFEGREIQVKTPTAIIWSRMFLVNGMVYSLIFGSTTNGADDQNKFFGSFTTK